MHLGGGGGGGGGGKGERVSQLGGITIMKGLHSLSTLSVEPQLNANLQK